MMLKTMEGIKKRISGIKILFLLFLFCFSSPVIAKINFKAVTDDRIDIETIELTKNDFFTFLDEFIKSRPKGLGNYGTVAFQACEYKINNMRLIDHKTMEGKEIKFLTNPTCDQVFIKKVLEKGYQYQSGNLTYYENRKCLLNIESIFSPILEYYTLKYEERTAGNCSSCDFKEDERLKKILRIQDLIQKSCKSETAKVVEFLADFDANVEKSMKEKSNEK